MTPLESALTTLDWTQRGLARQLGVDEKQVRRWVKRDRMPAPVMAWLERLVALHRENPAPRMRG